MFDDEQEGSIKEGLESPIEETFESQIIEPAESTSNYYRSFEIDELNPYAELKKYTSSIAKDEKGIEGRLRTPIKVYGDKSFIEYQGERLRAQAQTYNRLQDRVNTLAGADNQINRDYLVPQGFVARPTDKDYNYFINKQLREEGTGLRASFFQFQAQEVVSNLATKNRDISIVTQAMGDDADAKGAALLAGNEITQAALGKDKVSLVKMDEVDGKSPSFHPKIAYFYKKDEKDGKNTETVTGLLFGTQNITPALANNNTLEEAWFIDVSATKNDIANKIIAEFKKTVDAITSSAQENRSIIRMKQDSLKGYLTAKHLKDEDSEKIKADKIVKINEFIDRIFNPALPDSKKASRVADIVDKSREELLQLINNIDDDYDELKAFTDEYLRAQPAKVDRQESLTSGDYILVNKDIQNRIKTELSALAGRGDGRAILNIQYLENLFKPSEGSDSEFNTYRRSIIDSISTLAELDRIIIATSNTSFDPGQGLFNLITTMRNVDRTAMSDKSTDAKAYDAYQKLIEKGALRTQPVQYMHSKVLAITKGQNKDEKVDTILTMSANASYQAYANNFELGFVTSSTGRMALGLNDDELNKYYLGTLAGDINKGLLVERRGRESMVEQTISLLRRIGGIEDGGQDAKFTFSRRYTQIDIAGGKKGVKLSGLDIKVGNQRTFSVTIGSYTRREVDATGNIVSKESPIIYLNKGNRMITGAGYKYSGSKPLFVESLGETIQPNDSFRIDANQVLAGIVETLSRGYEYERDGRSLLLALEYLDRRVGIDQAIERLSIIEEGTDKSDVDYIKQKKELGSKLKAILTRGDTVAIKEYAQLAKSLIATSREAGDFYRQSVRASSSALFNQMVDVFPQTHELPYSAEQALYNLSIVGADDTNLELLLADNEDRLGGLILSQIALRHEDTLLLGGRAAIRGVAAVSRPTSLSPLDMIGGLHKSRESAPKAIDAEFMNSQPGMRLIRKADYQQKLQEALGERFGAEREDIVNSIMRKTFGIYLTKEQESDKELDENASLLYFPFPKTEQISQRLKNTLSIRPFNYTSKKLQTYMRGFGLVNEGKIEDINWNSGSHKLRATILSSLPDNQYRELEARLERVGDNQKERERVIDEIISDSINPDSPSQGYVGEEKIYLASMGASQQSDFAYINASVVRGGGFLYQHRSQVAISAKEVTGDVSNYINTIREKLKVGTLFTASKIKIDKDDDASKALYDVIKEKLLEAASADGPKPSRLEDITDIKRVAKSIDWIDKVFDVNNKDGKVEIYLKKGVYNTEEVNGKRRLVKIGGLDESTGKFYIDDLYKSKLTSSDRKLGRLYIGAPAFARRATKGITVLSDISVGEVDKQPGMFTLNMEFLTDTALDSGMRGSTVKGPMLMMALEYFKEVKKRYTGTGITDAADIFGVMGAGQMKGFIFGSGFSLLKEDSTIEGDKLKYNPLQQQDSSQRVVEALGLMFINNSKVRKALAGMFEGRDDRSQALSTLKLWKGEADKVGKEGDGSWLDAYTSTMGIYEGLVGLLDDESLKAIAAKDNSINVEEALIETIVSAATDKDKRNALLARAQQMIADTAYIPSVEEGKEDRVLTFNEHNNRSSALLAHYMEAGLALFSNAAPGQVAGSLSELGYTKGPTGYTTQALQRFYEGRINAVYTSDKDRTEATGRINSLLRGVSDKASYRDLLTTNEELRSLAGSADRYMTDSKFAERYYKASKAAGIQLLPSSEIREESQEEVLDSQLYSLQAIGNANRYVKFVADAAINRITPPVGMQDSTDLEGHYAASMTKKQLKLYTDSAKDLEKYTTIQGAVITLGTLIDAQAGYMGRDTSRSSYRMQVSNIVEAGLPPTTLPDLDKYRIQALTFASEFGQAYFDSASKSLPRILDNKEAENIGLISKPIAFSVFRKFAEGQNYGGQLRYMEQVKAITSEVSRSQSDGLLNSRVDLLVEDYLRRVVSETGDLKSQAEYLVKDLTTLITDVNNISSSMRAKLAAEIAKATETRGVEDIAKEYVKGLNLSLADGEVSGVYNEAAVNFKLTKLIGLTESDNTLNALRKRVIDIGKEDRLPVSLDALKESISSLSNRERKDTLALVVSEILTTKKKAGADKETLEVIVTAGDRKDASAEELIAYSLMRSLIGKEFRDKIESSLNMDAGKEYLLGRQELFRYTREKLARGDADAVEIERLTALRDAVGNTQAIEIPVLERLDGFSPKDGKSRMFLRAEQQEQGWLLGLDLLENVALIFPDFSSQALNAQYELTESIREVRESGVLEEIGSYLSDTNAELILDSAQIESYERLRRAAAQSRITALELINNTKTIRNAMGDQLSMKGASYIAMASYLLDEDQVMLGDRFDSVLKAGEASLDSTINTMITGMKEGGNVGRDLAESLSLIARLYNPNSNLDAAKILAMRTKSDGGKVVNTTIREKILGDARGEKLEQILFMSNILFGRQGAPSGSGPGYSIGSKAVGIEEYNRRANEVGSLMQLDDQMNKTTMILSMLGPQFTQLGDYDGDSFQAATNRMSEIVATYKKAREEYARAVNVKEAVEARSDQADAELNEWVTYNTNSPKALMAAAAKKMAENLSAMNQLQKEAREGIGGKLRGYANELIGLPLSLFEGPGATKAIRDIDIADLIKQSRDTASGFYDNRDKLFGWFAEAVEKIQTVSDKTITWKDGEAPKFIQDDDTKRDLLLGIIEESKLVTDFNNKDSKRELIDFYAQQVQNYVAFGTIGKQTDKLMGSLMSESALREVQAVIGSTGTGLLGKSYNTVIPLLSMASGATAAMQAFDAEDRRVRDTFGESISKVKGGLDSEAKDGTEQIELLDFLQNRYGLSTEGSGSLMETEGFRVRRELQATTGLLLDVQQFLRDAALKPKEKGGIGEVASRFTLEGNQDQELEWANGITGLANLLDDPRATAEQRSRIMDLFISKEIGAELELDTLGDQYKGDISREGLKAFSALHMMNEYLSGRYSASEMLSNSIFSPTLTNYKDRLQQEREGEVVSDREVVERALYGALTKFQTNFAYTNVLEGKKYGDILAGFTEKIKTQYDITEGDIRTSKPDGTEAITKGYVASEGSRFIDSRTAEYKEYLEQQARKQSVTGGIKTQEEALSDLLRETSDVIKSSAIDDAKRERGRLLNELPTVLTELESIKAYNDSIEDKYKLGIEDFKRKAPFLLFTGDKESQKIINKFAADKTIEELKSRISVLEASVEELESNNNKTPKQDETLSRVKKELEIHRAISDNASWTPIVNNNLPPSVYIDEFQATLERHVTSSAKDLQGTSAGAIFDITEGIFTPNTRDEDRVTTILSDNLARLDNLEVPVEERGRVRQYRENAQRLLRFYENRPALESKLNRAGYFTPGATGLSQAEIDRQAVSNIREEVSIRQDERAQAVRDIEAREVSQLTALTQSVNTAREINERLSYLRAIPPTDVTDEQKGIINKQIQVLQEARDKYISDTTASREQGSRSLSEEEQNRINVEVARFELQEREIQSRVLDALNKPVEGTTPAARDEARARNVFYDLIQYELSERNKFLLSNEKGEPGGFEKLRTVNTMISRLRENSEYIGVDTSNLEVMNLAFFNLMRRGKADGNIIAQVTQASADMAEAIRQGGAIQDKNAYLNMLGMDLPGVDEEINKIVDRKLQKEIKGIDLTGESIERKAILQNELSQRVLGIDLTAEGSEPAFSEEEYVEAGATDEERLRLRQDYRKVKDAAIEAAGKSLGSKEERLRARRKELQDKLKGVYVDALLNVGEGSESVVGQVASYVSETSEAAALAAQQSTLQTRLASAQEEGDTTQATIIEAMLGNLGPKSQSEAKRFTALSNTLREVDKALRGEQRKFNRGIIAEAINKDQAQAKKGYGVSGLMSLMVVPAIFTLAQGDITFNDRVASMMTDVATTAMTTASYQESSIRKVLYGHSQESIDSGVDKAERAGDLLRRARISMALNSSYSKSEGLAQGIGFEALMMSSGIVTNKFINSVSKGGGTAASAVAELATGFVLSGVMSLVNKRNQPGTFINNDDQWAITNKMLQSIYNNMLMVEQQVMTARTEEDDYIYSDVGNSLSEVASAGFDLQEDNTSMSIGERLMLTMSNLEMTEEVPIESYV